MSICSTICSISWAKSYSRNYSPCLLCTIQSNESITVWVQFHQSVHAMHSSIPFHVVLPSLIFGSLVLPWVVSSTRTTPFLFHPYLVSPSTFTRFPCHAFCLLASISKAILKISGNALTCNFALPLYCQQPSSYLCHTQVGYHRLLLMMFLSKMLLLFALLTTLQLCWSVHWALRSDSSNSMGLPQANEMLCGSKDVALSQSGPSLRNAGHKD